MTIYVGSRYEDAVIDRVEIEAENYVPTVYPQELPAAQGFNFSYHVVSAGDRLDTLADRHLGDSELYWVIANANPEVLYPDALEVGTVLRIPDRHVR